jgi:hypothetical protein
MRVMGVFDESVAKVMTEKVKARMSFKVRTVLPILRAAHSGFLTDK